MVDNAPGGIMFSLGFKEVADRLGVEAVGTPLTPVRYFFHPVHGEMAEQYTTEGLFRWVKSVNHTYFFPSWA